MKQILYFLMLACFITGCKKNSDNNSQEEEEWVEEPENSVAKETTWDFHLLGQWHFIETGNESGKTSKYTEGIEVFHADGSYECYTQTSKGVKVIINGTWKLDDENDFVLWVTQKESMDAKGNESTDTKRLKYTIYSLSPGQSLTYQVGKVTRTATYISD